MTPSNRIHPADERHPGPVGGGFDHADLRELWLSHRRWIGAILLAHKPAHEDLEDLLHEVALRLVRSADDLRDPAAVRPWLRTVAINVARTAGRRTKVRRDGARSVADSVSDRAERSDLGDAPAPERLGAREEAQRAMDAAGRLPEHYREPLLLRAVRGMSYRQIADTLGIPITTVETRLARARRMLREELEPTPDPSYSAGDEA
jgi:RNA polymerase sigma-70 factor, ECF subfamily